MLPLSYLQEAFTGSSSIALAEWFAASVGLVLVVTFLYLYVLNRSPPPEGPTVAKMEREVSIAETSGSAIPINDAQQAILTGNYGRAVEISTRGCSILLGNLIQTVSGDTKDMNISDIAYLIQSRAKSSPQISQAMYQLNSLRLRVAQGQQVTREEAEWSVSILRWLMELVESKQISF